MNNNLVKIKIEQRLNKLSSSDFDNITCWQMAEAINKAQIELVRNQVHGNNLRREGDESTKVLIDDLQKILTFRNLTSSEFDDFYQTESLPSNYLHWKKISVKGKNSCCPDKSFRVRLAEVANEDELLNSELKKPNFKFAETFATISSNRIKIFTGGDFSLNSPRLDYYRKPVEIQFNNCININTGVKYTSDVELEFKDDFVELILDRAVSILAGDIESITQHQLNDKYLKENN